MNKHSNVETNQSELDGRSYLLIHQSQEKWENAYPFLFFSEAKNGWLCSVCSKYGKGDKFWRTKGVKQEEHPKQIFEQHQKSPKHEEALTRQTKIKAMLWKGSVYKQSLTGVKGQGQKRKRRNRAVIKKISKTTSFLAQKKWAVRENFQDVIEFIKDLGDEDLSAHLRGSSARATYVLTASTDEFIRCLSDFLEQGFINRLTAAREFSLLADETTDIAGRAELAIFIRYVDSDCHQVKQEFLGVVEVVGSTGAEALCQIICKVLREKGVDINQLRLNGFDGTNTMSGEISGLQRRLQHLVPHAKYVNCRNHRLALVFVYLISKFQVLADVDALILAVWKLMKYSSVKVSVFGAAQTVEGLKNVKLLKAAPTRWLSHGDASQRLV